jgi:preprotein translocase subunit SecD
VLALAAAPTAGVQTTPDGNQTVVGAEIGDDVADRTVENVVSTLEARLDSAGVDGHVATARADGTQYVTVVTDADRETVTALLRDRGRVEIVARFPVQGNGSTVYREETLLSNEDFVDVGSAQAPRGTVQPNVPVTLTENAARNYSRDLQEYGFTDEGIGNCPPDADQSPDDATGHCLYTVDDGEVLYAASMGRQLARAIQNGEFVADPSFIMTASNLSTAERLSVTLQSGAYPTSLSVGDLPEPVERSALSTAGNASGETGGTSTDATTGSTALGPGFTPVAALLAVVASTGLLARGSESA